ncbi:unnamed protein product [Caenorhabditis sp. 36 PRJEB53466]|nr:unnamed protein product [Caenorhabditis sp. 36 PRJEB53466]
MQSQDNPIAQDNPGADTGPAPEEIIFAPLATHDPMPEELDYTEDIVEDLVVNVDEQTPTTEELIPEEELLRPDAEPADASTTQTPAAPLVVQAADNDPMAAEPTVKFIPPHPWYEYYSHGTSVAALKDDYTDNPQKLMSDVEANFSTEDAARFIGEVVDNGELERDDGVAALMKGEPMEIGTLPSGPGAPYRIIHAVGTSHTAAAIFYETFTDRPDVRNVKITARSGCPLQPNGDIGSPKLLLEGDIVWITALYRNTRFEEEPQTVQWSNTADANATTPYTVKSFILLPRLRVRDVLCHPTAKTTTTLHCIAQGIFSEIKVPAAEFPKPVSMRPMIADVISPVKTNSFLGSLTMKLRAKKSVSKIPVHGLARGTLRNIRDLPAESQKVTRTILSALNDPAPKNEVVLRQMGALATHAVQILVNGPADLRPYTTRIIDSRQTGRGTIQLTLVARFFGTAPNKVAWGQAKEVELTMSDKLVIPATSGIPIFNHSESMELKAVVNRFNSDRFGTILLRSADNVIIMQQQAEEPSHNPVVTVLLAQEPMNHKDNNFAVNKALFGSEPLELLTPGSLSKPDNLTESQARYVNTICFSKTRGLIAECGFGGGKSTTMVITARTLPGDACQLLLATSNAAIVNLCQVADKHGIVGLVRIITERHRDELDFNLITKADLPVRIVEAVKNLDDAPPGSEWTENEKTLLIHGFHRGLLKKLPRTDKWVHSLKQHTPKRPSFKTVAVAYLRQLNKRIMAATITSALTFFHEHAPDLAKLVKLVQCDEASQIPVATYQAITLVFPNAVVTMVGDRRLLPPLTPETNKKRNGLGVISRLGTDSALSHASDGDRFPTIAFRESFRCPRDITNVLSKNFYSGELQAMRSANDHGQHLPRELSNHTSRSSVQWIEIPARSHRQAGSSLVNTKEAEIVTKHIDALFASNYTGTVAVLSFYGAQKPAIVKALSHHEERSELFIGTVDCSQGREFDTVFVLLTRSDGQSSFIDDPRRVNAALSRTKDWCFVVASAEVIAGTTYWRRIKEMTR